MPSFEDQAITLVATAAELASLRGAASEAEVLRNAKASLVLTGHDNWNGGTDIYTLMLEVPLRLFAKVEDDRDQLEKAVSRRLDQLLRGYNSVSVSEVVISPVLVDQVRPPDSLSQTDQIAAPEEASPSVPSYWSPGHFRLFISHASEKRDSAHRLKEALSRFQIVAFVAHDDIEPTREWQAEIETALRTMDALAAIISPAFLKSSWCDQEVGMAVGRAKLVVPLRAGADPHGFLGKYQGLQTKGCNATTVAKQVFEILLKHDLTSHRMVESLVDRLVQSGSWASSRATMAMLATAPALSETQAGRLLRAINENPEVGNAISVQEQIRDLISRVGAASAS